MDFRRLEAFSKVYELRSFSKAGQDLFLSQPTISAHISTLEDELGVQLFDRLGRSVLPTQAGDVLYRNAQFVFEQLERARSELLLLRDKVVGDLHIGGSTIPSHYLLPRLLSGFTRRYPEVRAHLTVGDTEEILHKVSDGRLILGLVGARPESPAMTAIPVLTDELVVVGPPGLVNGHKNIDAARLASWPWVMRESGSGTRRAFEAALAKSGLGLALRDLKVAVWVQSTEAALQCVKAGLGLSVTSRLAAAAGLAAGDLALVDAVPLPLERSFYLVHQDGRNFFPAVRAFLSYVQDHCK